MLRGSTRMASCFRSGLRSHGRAFANSMTATPKVTSMDAEESWSTDLTLKYDLVLESVAVGDRSFSIHRVRDTNALLDALTPDDLTEEDRFPYWTHLWNSSLAL